MYCLIYNFKIWDFLKLKFNWKAYIFIYYICQFYSFLKVGSSSSLILPSLFVCLCMCVCLCVCGRIWVVIRFWVITRVCKSLFYPYNSSLSLSFMLRYGKLLNCTKLWETKQIRKILLFPFFQKNSLLRVYGTFL